MTDMKTLMLSALALVASVAVPAAAFAATYAYVDQMGDVRTVEAVNADSALMTAPSIHVCSGVMLLDSEADNDVVGDDVQGV